MQTWMKAVGFVAIAAVWLLASSAPADETPEAKQSAAEVKAQGSEAGKAAKPTGEASPRPIRGGSGPNDYHNPEYKKVASQILGMRNRGEEPRPGDVAPDFALTPLKFYKFKTEETEITQENADVLYEPVRLSSFRGKKPVVLIFGSYT